MNFFRTLDWGPWLYRLLKGAVGAGSSSIVSMFGTFAVDPKDFYPGSAKSLKVMGITFLYSFGKYVFTYLQDSPLPPIKTVTTTQVTSQTSNPKATVVQTVEKTEMTPGGPSGPV